MPGALGQPFGGDWTAQQGKTAIPAGQRESLRTKQNESRLFKLGEGRVLIAGFGYWGMRENGATVQDGTNVLSASPLATGFDCLFPCCAVQDLTARADLRLEPS